jgi:hypothetical protein
MTNTQHVALSGGMILFSLLGLMPPWVHVRADDPTVRIPAGHAFITIGAPVRSEVNVGEEPAGDRRQRRFRTYRGVPVRWWESRLDARRLAIQWLGIALVTTGLVWFLAPSRRRSRTPSA